MPASYAAPIALRCWKHSLQNTGRPCVGRKGTVVSFPHAEHWVCVSTRSRIDGPALTRFARLALHPLQRFGSFLNCLSAKKSCSPAVQMNSDPQSTHVRALSWNSIGRHLCSSSIPPRADRACGPPSQHCLVASQGDATALLCFASKLLPITLSRQRLFRAAFVSRLQVKGVL